MEKFIENRLKILVPDFALDGLIELIRFLLCPLVGT